MYNERRFSDVTMYMQQLMDSFKNFKKVSKALEDTASIFPDGPMANTIQRAKEVLLSDVSGNPERVAFAVIENEYPCEKLSLMHNFLIRAENIGGDFSDGIDILQRDRSHWVEHIKTQQSLRKSTKRNVVISMIMCAAVIVMAERYVDRIFPVTENLISQITTVILIFCDLFLYSRADKKLTVEWIKGEYKNDEQTQKDYDYVVNFNPKKYIKPILLEMLIPIGLVTLAVVFHFSYFLIGLLLVPYYIALPFWNYNSKKRALKREIDVQFSSWLMQIGLELQTKPVQPSIQSSLEYAPVVLKPEIELLLKRLNENPTASQPYIDFMKDFYSPDISQSMRSLYSISAGAGGNIKERIRDIVMISMEHLNKTQKKLSQELAAMDEFFLIVISSVPLAGKIGIDVIVATLQYVGDYISNY